MPPATAQQQPTTERRTQAERRAQSERRIIRAALEVIAEHGVQRMSLADVGERAGFSRGLPAHLFGNRSALLCECVRRVIHVHWLGGLPQVEDGDGFGALILAVRRWTSELSGRPVPTRAFFLLMQEAIASDAESLEPELIRLIREVVTGGEERYRGYIEAGQASGQIRADIDAGQEALMVHTVMRGISLRWLLKPDAIDLPAFEARYVAQLGAALLVN